MQDETVFYIYIYVYNFLTVYLWLQSIHQKIIYKHCKMKLYSTYVFMCTTPSMYIFMASKNTYIKRWIANYIYMIICVYIFYLCIYVYNFINVFMSFQKMNSKLHLYDNMCMHILHIMYLWLCRSTYFSIS